MGYQVWTKDEYEAWKRTDCEDLPAAQVQILAALKAGREPLLTVEIPFEVKVEIKEAAPTKTPLQALFESNVMKRGMEVKVHEVATSEAEPGDGPGAEGTS